MNQKKKRRETKRQQEKGYREIKRVRLIEYLREHPCVDCGETDLRVLDFDHIDPSVKEYGVSRLANSGHASWKRVLEEISKCEVRCSNCHRKKTIGEPEWFTDFDKLKSRVEELLAKREAAKPENRVYICGTRVCYINGCRCDECREANRVYHVALRKKNRVRE